MSARIAPLLTIIAGVLAAAAVAMPRAEQEPPALQATAAGGMQLGNSKDGEAILNAAGMQPGDSTSGELVISNKGGSKQKLWIDTFRIQDDPGPRGGVLSEQLDLEILRVIDSHQVYAGKLSDLDELQLADLPPGGGRTYRFTITFPEQGAAIDSAYVGAGAEVTWRWKGESETGPDKPDKPEKPEQQPEPQPTTPAQGGGVTGSSGTPRRPETVSPGSRSATASGDEEGMAPSGTRAVRVWVGGARSQRLAVTRRKRGVRSMGFNVFTRCRPACTVSAAAKVRIGGRWRALPTRRLGTVSGRGAAAKLGFTLNPRELRVMRAALRRKPLQLVVTLRATSAGHQPATLTQKLTLKR